MSCTSVKNIPFLGVLLWNIIYYHIVNNIYIYLYIYIHRFDITLNMWTENTGIPAVNKFSEE